jgi:hypothetical protein
VPYRGKTVCPHVPCRLVVYVRAHYDDWHGRYRPWFHHYYLCATPILGLRSLGLGVARRVVGPVDGSRSQA